VPPDEGRLVRVFSAPQSYGGGIVKQFGQLSGFKSVMSFVRQCAESPKVLPLLPDHVDRNPPLIWLEPAKR